ncbi:50S ribosomal protein L6 [Mycoplasmopsis pullorum]|uniref:50S ribosomal protein L6 n=1 Tax=Mycoplasmopsis pullorum TaxID=48003 RepID=UPI001118F2F3|nr:50S ribosomal protein L6 [Mycoplasmopsis pullorum]TNK82056.1 50S ribosomal protein L6 [Mycoplasmopsis pullorum]TNK82731.1 50S ribosomal protein L6 [Mycoplasmopsis pullorum]TNK84847.1 50S ribosomal protein L6 [Mycoplasmopsis pullorum]TNK85794.1 50S ribosomal protein L6 [Mycoplasmopsis pullorum]TNK86340.1 50S ribosomal protein L6 [Mycoplasmopsis pullorum]
MSRVGNRVLTIPAGTTITVDGTKVTVKGKLGTLERVFSPKITVKVEDNQVTTVRANEEKHTKQLHGTTNAHISNMLKGVSEGFKKDLEIKGVGYKAVLKGSQLVISAGYSHEVTLNIPSDVQVVVSKPTEVSVSGIDKQSVGQFASQVRAIRKPNPYSGKGIAYKGEYIRRKEGKTASK